MEAFIQKSLKFIVYVALIVAGAILVLLGSHDKKRAIGETQHGDAISLFAQEAHADAPACSCSGDAGCSGSCSDGMPDAGGCDSDSDADGDGDGG